LHVYLTESLTLDCHTHSRKSKLTATVTWTYRSGRSEVDSWVLRVRNLTWEQNDYQYDNKEFRLDGGASHDFPQFAIYRASACASILPVCSPMLVLCRNDCT